MANIAELLAEAEAEEARLTKGIAERRTVLQHLVTVAENRGDRALTAQEDAYGEKAWDEIQKLEAAQRRIADRLANLREVKADEDRINAASAQTFRNPALPASYWEQQERTERVHVTREARAYNRGNDPTGGIFLQDVARQFLYGDMQSTSRLSRHMAEERVERAGYSQRIQAAGDLYTTDVDKGLVVPAYLVDMVAPKVANMRPFADICNKHPLPPTGMTVTIPVITTAASVTDQPVEMDDAAHVTLVQTDLDLTVYTASGRQNVSRQALERGNGVEAVVFDDLMRRYATNLDSELINKAAVGLTNVATDTNYTDASPTGAKLYPYIQGCASKLETAVRGQAVPSHVIMHPRRWYWLTSEMTDTWPLINSQSVPPMAAGIAKPLVGANAVYGVRGVLPNGLLVVADANITTAGGGLGQDEIFVVAADECHLWESPGAPVMIRAEQPLAGNLGVQLVIYGYYSFTFNRYSGGMQKLSDTGLAAPTGF